MIALVCFGRDVAEAPQLNTQTFQAGGLSFQIPGVARFRNSTDSSPAFHEVTFQSDDCRLDGEEEPLKYSANASVYWKRVVSIEPTHGIPLAPALTLIFSKQIRQRFLVLL